MRFFVNTVINDVNKEGHDMDITTNEKSTQRSAAFLDQCRADIDQLAAEGAPALEDAMVFAEKQLRACTMEWNIFL